MGTRVGWHASPQGQEWGLTCPCGHHSRVARPGEMPPPCRDRGRTRCPHGDQSGVTGRRVRPSRQHPPRCRSLLAARREAAVASRQVPSPSPSPLGGRWHARARQDAATSGALNRTSAGCNWYQLNLGPGFAPELGLVPRTKSGCNAAPQMWVRQGAPKLDVLLHPKSGCVPLPRHGCIATPQICAHASPRGPGCPAAGVPVP